MTDAAPQPTPSAPNVVTPPVITSGLYLNAEEDGRWHYTRDRVPCACGNAPAPQMIHGLDESRFGFVAPELFCSEAHAALRAHKEPPPPPVDPSAAAPPPAVAIVPAPKIEAVPFLPRDTGEMFRYAGFLARANIVPKALIGKPSDILVVLLKGQDLGLTPMQSIAGINVIDGKAEVGALMMVALILKSGMCDLWKLVESTSTKAVFKTKRRGDDDTTTFEYTIEEAAQMGLLDKGRTQWAKDNNQWKRQPRTMLRRRCQSMLAREVYPDICAGLYDHDELAEMREIAEQERAGARELSIDGDDAGTVIRDRPPEQDPDEMPRWAGGTAPDPAPGQRPSDGSIPGVHDPAMRPPPRDPLKQRLNRRQADNRQVPMPEPGVIACSKCGEPCEGKPGDQCYACRNGA